ncbi:hypothetical protein Clacol_000953 [Clathrus columnatus]|uniref:Uncharacterized protein n=1 Tax=Clathrus columnatus TaxID=1419009 RepID=A0AAV4ZZR2_9AGAM|nr:hypothetical protein Clacol_000953 [Clathrus columnatus]
MTHAFFSLMEGFIITDEKQIPVRLLVLDSPNFDLLTLKSSVKAAVKTQSGMCIKASEDTIFSTKTAIAADKEFKDDWAGFPFVAFPRSAGSTSGTNLRLAVADAITNVVLGVALESVLFETDHEIVLNEFEKTAIDAASVAVDMALNIVADEWEVEEAYDSNDELFSYKPQDRVPSWLRDRIREKLRDSLRTRLQDNLRDRDLGIRKTLKSCLKEDIEDKSKQDSFAKSFALAQTTWFVVHCIARRVKHLPLTEIELMTCAYEALSAAIYLFWWHKPFRVDQPIMIRSEIPHKTREVHQPNPWNITTPTRFCI